MKKNSSFKSLVSIVWITSLLVAAYPGSVAAASPRISITQSSNFSMRISVSSDEPVNAYDLTIAYDPELVAIDRVDTSHSIITIAPVPIKAANGKIVIKGGSGQAFVGSDGELATLYLRPIVAGVMQWELVRGRVYKADGTGEELAAGFNSSPLSVTQASLTRYAQTQLPVDQEAPKIIAARVEENPIEETPPMVVLDAQDAQSGVSEYRARTISWVTWSQWQQATNPYPLAGGEWAIEIAAVDNSANVATQVIYRPGVAALKGSIVLLAFAAILFAIVRFLRGRRVKRFA
jgi:hypothetical protein